MLVAFCALVILKLPPLNAVPLPTKEEVAETAAWFNGLEWPDIRGKPYFEFIHGMEKPHPPGARALKVRGFLLAEDEGGFTIFGDGTEVPPIPLSGGGCPLAVGRIPKSEPLFTNWEEDTHRIIDLPTAVEELIACLRPLQNFDEMKWANMRRQLSVRTSVFIFARCCERQGRADLAERLDAEVMKLIGANSNQKFEDREPFRVATEKEIGRSLLGDVADAFGYPQVTRPQLLARLERIGRDFPALGNRPEVMENAATLRAMVAEDAGHARTAKPLEAMTADEKVREWIFRLRDQNGRQIVDPGECDVFLDVERLGAPGISPAHQLAALGDAAVPALIDAIGDPRFSRSVHRGRWATVNGRVMTVGDCALAVLARISGEKTWTASIRLAEMSREEHAKAARAGAEDWWRRVQGKGRLQP